ncbi:MAG: Plug domain-containing protein [bacterium]|nr:Plug domain-containing protein [bacterium]
MRPVTTAGGVAAVEVQPDSLALPAAPTLEEIFRELPHLHVRTNSRGEAEISVRGSDSRQVAVLVDGVPITLAWDSRIDASMIPSSAPQELGYVTRTVVDAPRPQRSGRRDRRARWQRDAVAGLQLALSRSGGRSRRRAGRRSGRHRSLHGARRPRRAACRPGLP